MRDRSVLIPQVTSMKPHRGVTGTVALSNAGLVTASSDSATASRLSELA